ncbi:hypothetical protein AGJ34_20490 [Cronobacter dublinensis subsp. dublinensis]|nr:hypothetical protein [Cronobacter dublinensis subsp. dublinensis]EGT5729862.1 hypothetical protein [Cronobacter dublinensis subsp. dublinensis]
MKVHVTVDEDIYPELYELLVNTPIAKRARVLANLAYKACLLSNVALMNPELIAPPKGRKTAKRKSRSTPQVQQVVQKNDDLLKSERQLIESEPAKVIDEGTAIQSKDKEGNTSERMTNQIEGAGASEMMDKIVITSVQSVKTDGEGGDDIATPTNKRRRRILN